MSINLMDSSKPRKVVMATTGSPGDLLPFLGLARELAKRGHQPVIVTSSVFREAVERAQARFVRLRPESSEAANDEFWVKAMHPHTGTLFLYKYGLMPHLRDTYDDLLEAVQDADLLISHPIIFVAPLVAQNTNVPWISCVLSPIVFNSRFDPPITPFGASLTSRKIIGKPIARALMRIVNKRFQPVFEPLVQLRRELNLPDREQSFLGTHSPTRVLALFSPLYCAPQRDWPPQTRITGFCEYDDAPNDHQRVLEPQLQRFLDAGEAPILFTLGASSVHIARDFWQESLLALRRLKRRAIWTVGKNRASVPNDLPDSICAIEYAPLSQVLPHCAAIVSHGGAGTIAHALRAGIPGLLVPQSHDQPDNAAHAARMGSSRMLWRHHYKAKRVTRELNALLNNARYKQKALEIQRLISQENGVQTACDEIEKVLQIRR